MPAQHPAEMRLERRRRRGISSRRRRCGRGSWSVGGWRRRIRRTIGCLHVPWNLVPLGIHALLICIVVTSLDFSAGAIRLGRTQGSTPQKTGPCSDGSAWTHISGGSTDQSTRSCSQRSTGDRSSRQVFIDGLIGIPTGLVLRPLTTDGVIGLERFEGLAIAGHHQDTRARRDRCTTGEHQHDRQYPCSAFQFHFSEPSIICRAERYRVPPSSIRPGRI